MGFKLKNSKRLPNLRRRINTLVKNACPRCGKAMKIHPMIGHYSCSRCMGY